jgi:large subunit ribosomal protein L3
MLGIIGQKLGMTRLFDELGNAIPVTVIQAGPCVVIQVKTQENDSYNAIQLGFGERKAKNTPGPLKGHLKKSGDKLYHILKEVRDFEAKESLKPGDEIKADIFNAGDKVSISGISKGRGFAGVVKRHKFGGGPKTHGQSDRLRAPGSIGQSSYPSRVFKGTKMAGRMGAKSVTVRNMQIVKVDSENNLLIVKGAIPGAPKGYVIIKK